jgi:hypothetical protein
MIYRRFGNGILVMPKEDSPGWLFYPGDIGWGWALRQLKNET